MCIEELVDAQIARAYEHIQLLIEMESCNGSGPFTVNKRYYTDRLFTQGQFGCILMQIHKFITQLK